MSVEEAQQIAVHELQNQMSAMQAALEGNSQASLFKPKIFNGFPSEDVNEARHSLGFELCLTKQRLISTH